MLADLSFVCFYSYIVLNLRVKKNSPTGKGVKSMLGIGVFFLFFFQCLHDLEMRGYNFKIFFKRVNFRQNFISFSR